MSLHLILCDGCIGNGRVASFCRDCAMRKCALDKEGVTRCSDCKNSVSSITQFAGAKGKQFLVASEDLQKAGSYSRNLQAGIKTFSKPASTFAAAALSLTGKGFSWE